MSRALFWRLSIWPINALGKLNLVPRAIDKENKILPWQAKNIFYFSFQLYPIKVAARIIIDIVIFFINVFIAILLAKIIENNTKHIVQYIIVLASVFLIKWLLNCIMNFLYFKIEENHCQLLNQSLININWKSDEKPLMNQLMGRDVSMFLESTADSYKPIYCVVTGILIAVFIVLKYGTMSIFAFLSLILFIPFSMYITQKADKINNKVIQISKQRLQSTFKWIDWWIYALNWQEKKPFHVINSLTMDEIKFRSKDSVWRGLDVYVIAYGKIVPVLFLSIFVFLFHNHKVNNIEILWVSFPLIYLIMSFPRIFIDYKNGNRVFNELKEKLQNIHIKNSPKEEITLDSSWEVWNGSLLDNLCFNGEHTQTILAILNLDKELLQIQEEISQKKLLSFGKNISAGQRTRVLVARGVNLAIHFKYPIILDISLDSLDVFNVKRVLKIVEYANQYTEFKYSNNVDTYLNNFDFNNFPSPLINETNNANLKKNDKNLIDLNLNKEISLWNEFKNWIGYKFILFLFPAVCLALLGTISYKSGNNTKYLFYLSILSGVSILWVVVCGYLVEWKVRKWAAHQISKTLLSLCHADKNDVIQKVSKDFQLVVERIAWYLHDLGWMMAIFAIVSLSLLLSNFLISALILSAFYIICIFLWRLFIPAITKTRLAAVYGFNSFLQSNEDLFCSNSLLKNEKWDYSQFRKNVLYHGINDLFRSRIEMLATKLSLSNFASLSLGFLFISTCTIVVLLKIPAEVSTFIFTGMLTVDNEIFKFFIALGGLKSQSLSLNRLRNIEEKDCELNSNVQLHAKNFLFLEGINTQINKQYLPFKVSEGGLYSLIGQSGLGKTQYLKYLAGLNMTSTERQDQDKVNVGVLPTIYLDRHMPEVLAWIEEKQQPHFSSVLFLNFIEKKLLSGFRVFFLDEVTTNFELDEAQYIIQIMTEKVKEFNSTIIIVDHRFRVDNIINLSDILS